MDFSVLNKYFDHVYVLTLERATERQEKMKEVLGELDYSFFTGVDKKDLTIDELVEMGVYDEEKAIALHQLNKPMNTGQIGCAWSHRLVYEDVVKNNYKQVLILEDDVMPDKEGAKLLEQTLLNLPEDWELLYLDYDKNVNRNIATRAKQASYHISRLLGKVKWTPAAIENMYARKHSENLLIAGMHSFSDAYAVTLQAAKKLVEAQTPICFCSDDLLAYACTNKLVNGYAVVPKAFQPSANLKAKSLIG